MCYIIHFWWGVGVGLEVGGGGDDPLHRCKFCAFRSWCAQISNTSRTKSQNLNVCRLVLHLSLPNPCVRSRMKIQLEERRQAMLQLHQSDQQVYCLLSCSLSLRWRNNDRDGVSNHQPRDCLLNHLFRRRSKKTSKLRVTGLCAGNSPGTGEFPAQMASYAEMFQFDNVIMY